MFYNEKFDGNTIVVTVKFANDIDPKEVSSFHEIVVDAFEVLFARDFAGEFFNIFWARPMMKGKCVWGIPKQMSSSAMERGFRNDYCGFTCYL